MYRLYGLGILCSQATLLQQPDIALLCSLKRNDSRGDPPIYKLYAGRCAAVKGMVLKPISLAESIEISLDLE